jgi:hypothetical protein
VASMAGRGRTPRDHMGVGRIAADAIGSDRGGTGRMAPGLTRCHDGHDVGPPQFIAAARRCQTCLLTDPSIQRSLRAATYYPLGHVKLILTPVESKPDYLGAKLESNRI